ncbi:MAG: FHA domain-containing protein [Candidatus Nanopelagicales bacterium]
MTEFALTLLRLAFLGALWLFIIITVVALRRDLLQPREAKPATVPAKPAKQPKPATPPKAKKTKTAKEPPRPGPTLVVTEGPLQNTVIPLGTAQITIGRAPDSTLVIDDDYASSRHARIYPGEGGWIVEDLGSTNGTWIDRTRITSPTILTPGAPLRIGRTTLQLQR